MWWKESSSRIFDAMLIKNNHTLMPQAALRKWLRTVAPLVGLSRSRFAI